MWVYLLCYDQYNIHAVSRGRRARSIEYKSCDLTEDRFFFIDGVLHTCFDGEEMCDTGVETLFGFRMKAGEYMEFKKTPGSK